MVSKIEDFANEMVTTCPNQVLTIATLGSRHGENDLSLSDIDLLVLCRTKADIPAVFKTSIKLKEKIFHLKPPQSTRWMQRFLLASNRYDGIHLIMLGQDEFDELYHPISLRLRILTKIFSRNIFLYEVKHGHTLLHGDNFLEKVTFDHLHFSDRLSCFLFPAIMSFMILPSLLTSRRDFKIWCFKVIKWHYQSLAICDKILAEEGEHQNHTLFHQAKSFRYKPDEFRQNVFALYFRIWWAFVKNLKFLFLRNRYSPSAGLG